MNGVNKFKIIFRNKNLVIFMLSKAINKNKFNSNIEVDLVKIFDILTLLAIKTTIMILIMK
jgi:hypothetical protein